MNHPEVCDRIEEYVLGTLDERTHALVESHVATCEKCRLLIVEYMKTSTVIAEQLEQKSPSSELRSRILQTASIESVIQKKSGEVVHRGDNRLAYFAIAATLVLAFFSYFLWNDRQNLRAELEKFRTENSSLQAELGRYEDATILLGQPGMQFVDLSGVDPNPQAFGKVILDPARGSAVVYMYKLPPTPEGKAYKLWVMREGRPTTAGEFTVASDGSAVLNLNSVSDMNQIATFQVTIEDAGSAQIPTGMMYLTGPYTPASN